MTDSLVAALRARVSQHPQREALIFLAADGRAAAYRYGRLDLDAQRYAGLLRAYGVQPGDLVIVAFEHGYDLVAAFWGALYHGAVPMIFPYADATGSGEARRRRLADLAAFTGAQAVLCPSAAQAEAAIWLAGQATRALALAEDAGPVAEGLLSPRSGEEIAYIQFSSGTTGQTKGVVLSHRAVLHNVEAFLIAAHFDEQDVGVSWLPFYHDMGLLTGVFQPLFAGALSVLMAPAHWIRRPQALFQAIDRYRGTMTWMPNFAFNHCLRTIRDEHLAGLDLSSWRILGNGSEPVQVSSLRRFAERFAPWGLDPAALTVGYGMAENVVVVSLTPVAQAPRADFVAMTDLQAAQRATPVSPEQPGAKAIASCGLPLPGVQVRVVDAAGQPLPERHVGEIAVAGPSLFSGYFGDAERTAQTLRDGWFHTGDLGYLADGELYVCDRLKDLIIIGGRNIFPESIEALAREVFGEQVRHVAAFGVPNEALGTELAVLVCELRGSPDDEKETQLAEQVRERVLAELDVALADVCFARGLVARTTSGKVARSATRVNYLAAGYRPQPPTSILSPALLADLVALEAALLALARQMLGVANLSPQGNLFEAGADSLMMLRMNLEVEERLGVRVSTDFFRAPTITHLARLISSEAAPAGDIPADSSRRKSSQQMRRLPHLSRRRLRQQITTIGPLWRGHALPYGLGVRLQRALVTQPWFQQRFYARQLKLVRRWQVELDAPQDKQALIISLLANTWLEWRNLALTQPGALERWVTMDGEGWRLFSQPDLPCGIVIVLPHVGRTIAPLQQVIQLQGRDMAKVANDPAIKLISDKAARAVQQTQSRAAQLWQAQQVLRRNGVVFIAGDGVHGNQAVEMPFWRRRRPFQIGAAELAVRTGALFMPVFVTLDATGRVHVEIMAPLTAQAESKEEKIVELTRQYGALYAANWPRFYASVRWHYLAYNINLPIV